MPDARRAALPRGLAQVPAVTVWAAVVLWPLAHSDSVAFLVANVLVAVSFHVTGVFMAGDPEHTWTSRALRAAGIVWPLNWVNEWLVGPWPLVAALVGPLASVLAGWALLRYPVRWRNPWNDRAVAAVMAAVQMVAVAVVVVSPPDRPQASPVWITLWPSWSAYHVLGAVYDLGGAIVAIGVLAGAAVRYRRLRGMDRRSMRPVVVAIALSAALTAGADAGKWSGLPDVVVHHLYLVEAIGLITVPLAFLVATVRRWFAIADLADIADSLRAVRTGPQVQELLRTVLDDPGLLVLYDDGAGSLVDVAGRPPTDPGRSRDALPLVSSRGSLLGVVLLDPSLRRHRSRVDPVLRTALRVLENARLQTLLHTRVVDATASAERLGTVVALEERRIVDELRRGPLRRLSETRRTLRDVASGLDGATAERLTGVLRTLTSTERDIDALAHGRPPSSLVERGLATAVAAAVPAGVTVDLPEGRYPQDVETAAYFSVIELVTNAVKHAGAQAIHVAGRSGAALVVVVADDGRGGADPDGPGLAGLAARAAALGGEMSVDSPHGTGTRVRLVLPIPQVPDQRPSGSGGPAATASSPSGFRPAASSLSLSMTSSEPVSRLFLS